MKKDELKYSPIYTVLKENKDAQDAIVKLGREKEWTVLKQFVAELKQNLLEATLEIDNIEQLKRYKYLIRGFESIALLPDLVKDVRELSKEEELDKEEKKRQAERRKYNPGTQLRKGINYLKNTIT